jgi:hypothetical protein
MGMKNLSRRNQIILYIISILLVLSMIISAIVSFSPTATSQAARPTATQVR